MSQNSSEELITRVVEPGELPRFPVEYVSTVEDTSIESFCGVDDFQDVEKYDGNLGVSKEFVQNHQSPVGQIQWNSHLNEKYSNPGNVSDKRWGSGTLISKDLFITAGHCVDSNPKGWTVPRIEGSNNPISPNEVATNMKVNFNYQVDSLGNLWHEQSYKVIELIEHRNGGLDYAILRLEGNPGEKYSFTKISKSDAKDKDMLCIIQHPEGKPKKIEAGPLTYIKDDERIGYNSIDTLGGSSGSGILHYNSGTIVGIHTNGGCNSSEEGINYGVRITSLIEVSPTLKKLL